MSFNMCFGEKHSCSSCCGLHNLDLPQAKKRSWLYENTKNFLGLNDLERKHILHFRESGEKFLQARMIRMDVYICPFMGIVNTFPEKTGCLLHNQGSPHPLIKAFDSPQGCGFYGESICQTYNCLSKQRGNDEIAQNYLNSIHPEKHDIFTYGKIAGNHNLLEVYKILLRIDPDIGQNLLDEIAEALDEIQIPVTSFEMPLSLTAYPAPELWGVLGTLLESQGYLFNAFETTQGGIKRGAKLKESLLAP